MIETTIVKTLMDECRRYFPKGEKFSRLRVTKTTGIDDSTLSKLEKGIREVRYTHIQPMCEYFCVTADYILERSKVGMIVWHCGETGTSIMSKDEVDSLYASGELSMEIVVKGEKEHIRRVLSRNATLRLMNEHLESSRQEQTQTLDSIFGTDTPLRKLVNDLIYIDNVDINKLKTIQDITTLIKNGLKNNV